MTIDHTELERPMSEFVLVGVSHERELHFMLRFRSREMADGFLHGFETGTEFHRPVNR